MTTNRVVAATVAPLVFPVRSGPAPRRTGAPGRAVRVAVPPLATSCLTARAYALAVTEARGRVTILTVAPVLGWDRATNLQIRECGRLIVITAADGPGVRMNRQGRVQIPIGMRRWCGLRPGSRVLLVADPNAQRLVIHPPAPLDALITRLHAELLGTGAS